MRLNKCKYFFYAHISTIHNEVLLTGSFVQDFRMLGGVPFLNSFL